MAEVLSDGVDSVVFQLSAESICTCHVIVGDIIIDRALESLIHVLALAPMADMCYN